MSMRSFSNFLTLLLALAGCVVAGVLTYEELHPAADIGCSKLGGDCSKTIQSKYGHLGPIPTSVLGLGMYFTVAGLCVARHKALRTRRLAETDRAGTYAGGADLPDNEQAIEQPADPTLKLRATVKRLDGALWLLSTLAIATSWWLQYAALYVLCSLCPWCFGSAAIVTLIFLLTTYDFLLEGRALDGEQKLLAIVTAFIAVCFAFVSAPVLLARITACGPTSGPVINKSVELSKRDLIVTKYLKLRGDPKSKYLLIEFADYQCPHCKLAAGRVEELLKTPPAGGIRFGFRNFTWDQHNWARQAAMAAEAAGEQGKFWQMHDMIFAHQDELQKPDFSQDRFDDWARELGLNIKRFDKDLQSPKISERIVNDHVAAKVTGLAVTPCFYLVTPTQVTMMSGIDELTRVWHDPSSPFWK